MMKFANKHADKNRIYFKIHMSKTSFLWYSSLCTGRVGFQVEWVGKESPLIEKEKGICVMGNKTYQRMQDHLLPHNVTAHIYRLLVMAH